ncbi:hypothetical protein C8J57DRAFT_1515827 [Mycena rebaudengoi]|nr:hypothetical protein C8J57DRAFT_1515827 [Mycena rebaudengoi]
MTESLTTNGDHQTARSLLVRILIFQARHLIADNSPLHVPDLRKREQVFDLVNLMSFTILFPAICSSSYAYLEDDKLPMDLDRFEGLIYAWGLICASVKFIDTELAFTSGEYESFLGLFEDAVMHMAVCLSLYKKAWHRRSLCVKEFTPTAFDNMSEKPKSACKMIALQ